MKTLLYNTITNEAGPERDGYYLVDGKPGVLPDYIVELIVTNINVTEYDYSTQTVEYREYADLVNKLWIKETYVRDLTEYEIELRKPIPPQHCSPRQFRLALLELNYDIDEINVIIDSIEDINTKNRIKIEWEYATEISRSNTNLHYLQSIMNITDSEMDNIFVLANQF